MCAFALLASWSPCKAETEAYYRDRFCLGMAMEQVLPNGTRLDCATHDMAVEVDFNSKWSEAVGQALSYAAETGKRPGVILICRSKPALCLKHSLLIEQAARFWKLPVVVWLCSVDDLSLADCSRRDY